jgi:3-hydroxyisobutyrate dehydrogenase-like beta-hydroxyacid dehydrogenase
VFNRTLAKAHDWASRHKGRAASSAADAAREAEFVFACVGADRDVDEVFTPALDAMAKDGVFVDHTTASATLARRLHAAAAQAGRHFIDAPVSGGQAGAENGRVAIMCGGDADAFARAEPVMTAYAAAATLIGPAGSGQLAKMVNQICIAGVVEGLAEGLHFARAAGLDAEKVIGAISKGAAQSWQMEVDDRGAFRLRLRGGLDAQGSGARARRSARKRRPRAGGGAGGPVLRRSAGHGRRALGHVQLAGAA